MHALASSASAEHYTPAWIIEKVRAVMGQIDLDPCSTPEANEVVQARRFYTKEQDGLTQRWEGRVFVNPPGDPQGKLPKLFWEKLAHEISHGTVRQFIWLAFNIGQLKTLQNVLGGKDLLRHCDVCIPRRRIQFSGPAPTKDNAILHWGSYADDQLFVKHFHDVGVIW